jgi:O-antigen/teichoic acid export membrane protein
MPRTFLMFFATSLAARGVGITCQLLQVPLVVHALGAEAFGLWMAMTSVTNLVLFADLGLGVGAQNRLAEFFAHKRHPEARELLSSVFLLLAAIGLVLGIVATAVLRQFDYASLFHLHDRATILAAPGGALAMAWVVCLGLPFGLAQRLAFARQQGWTYNVAQAGGSLGSLALVAFAAHAHASLVALVAGAQGAMLLGNAVLLGWQVHRLGWLRHNRFAIDYAAVVGLFRLGACFSVQQVLAAVLFTLPQIVISTCLGAAAVVPYNLLQRLFNLFAVVQNAFMQPLWPAYSKARAEGEFEWMRSALRHSLQATACFSVLPMVLGAIFAPQIVHLWVGGAAPVPEAALTWLLCTWNAVVFFQQPYSYLLAGVSEVRRTTLYSVLSAGGSASLMYALARPLGVPGVVLGLLVGYVPFNFVGNIVETRRYLRAACVGRSRAETSPPLAAPTT